MEIVSHPGFASLHPTGPHPESQARLAALHERFAFVELQDALDDAVASMDAKDVRGPIRTARGWHVLQLVERKAGDMKPFDEVKDAIRKQLYDQQVEKASQSWLKELRKKAHVDVRL